VKGGVNDMRQQDKVIMWPVYFDSMKTRSEGRRVSKNLGVPSPKALEVKEASDKAGLVSELVPDVGYPKAPWLKTGMVLVRKKGSKNQAIVMIAGQLLKMRSAAQPS
jgi:signal recognition particle subunit SRP19